MRFLTKPHVKQSLPFEEENAEAKGNVDPPTCRAFDFGVSTPHTFCTTQGCFLKKKKKTKNILCT